MKCKTYELAAQYYGVHSNQNAMLGKATLALATAATTLFARTVFKLNWTTSAAVSTAAWLSVDGIGATITSKYLTSNCTPQPLRSHRAAYLYSALVGLSIGVFCRAAGMTNRRSISMGIGSFALLVFATQNIHFRKQVHKYRKTQSNRKLSKIYKELALSYPTNHLFLDRNKKQFNKVINDRSVIINGKLDDKCDGKTALQFLHFLSQDFAPNYLCESSLLNLRLVSKANKAGAELILFKQIRFTFMNKPKILPPLEDLKGIFPPNGPTNKEDEKMIESNFWPIRIQVLLTKLAKTDSLAYAIKDMDWKLVDVLDQYDADWTAPIFWVSKLFSTTPAHLLVEHGTPEQIEKIFTKYPALCQKENDLEYTPCELAKEQGFTKISTMLKKIQDKYKKKQEGEPVES